MEDMLQYDKRLKHYSRELRKNMTDAEKLLWSRIRDKQLRCYHFYRQKPIGHYIVDFFCPKANLIVELDGGQHFSDEGEEKNKVRNDYMASLGIKVVRFSDREVFENLEGVIERIWSHL